MQYNGTYCTYFNFIALVTTLDKRWARCKQEWKWTKNNEKSTNNNEETIKRFWTAEGIRRFSIPTWWLQVDIRWVTVGNSYFIWRFCEGLEGEESDYGGGDCSGGGGSSGDGGSGDLVGKNADHNIVTELRDTVCFHVYTYILYCWRNIGTCYNSSGLPSPCNELCFPHNYLRAAPPDL